MVIDPSALLAFFQDESERRAFSERIEAAVHRRISAAILVELSIIVQAKLGAEGIRNLDLSPTTAEIELAPLTADRALLAREALRRFGKGRHPAGLDLGDSFSCALARAAQEPLLFEDHDFSRTDLTPVYSPGSLAGPDLLHLRTTRDGL